MYCLHTYASQRTHLYIDPLYQVFPIQFLTSKSQILYCLFKSCRMPINLTIREQRKTKENDDWECVTIVQKRLFYIMCVAVGGGVILLNY